MTKVEVLILCVVFSLNSGVDILEVPSTPRIKECYGTNMGFSFSGTHEFHYESLRRRYSGCTYVQGNLEITNLSNRNVTYDLSFLSSIEVVTGYVLLGLLNTETIPLTSLRLIRADNTMKLVGGEYGLVVALTSEGTPTEDNPHPGLKELQLPALREISQGQVLFSQNPLLCYVDTIAWDRIATEWFFPVSFKEGTKKHCKPCPEGCRDDDGVPRCWGPKQGLCQHIERLECDMSCPGRCYKEGLLGCCHPECAVGCHGNLDTECEMCKYFRYGHKCLPVCPDDTYPLGQQCMDF